jgi:hypothetical protein
MAGQPDRRHRCSDGPRGHLVPGGAGQQLLAVEASVGQRLLPGRGHSWGAEHRIHGRGGAARAGELAGEASVGVQQLLGRDDAQTGEQIQAAAQAEDLNKALRVLSGFGGGLGSQTEWTALRDHAVDQRAGDRRSGEIEG